MKWLAVGLTILLTPFAWPQIGTGTVLLIYFSKDEVTVAADSRVTASDGTHGDDECKISTFGSKFAFTMAGVAHRNKGSTNQAWNAHAIARRAWEANAPKHLDDAIGLAVAAEQSWTKEMKSVYSDPVIIKLVRSKMKVGDDPVLATAVFIATDNKGTLVVHTASLVFDISLYDSSGKIAVVDEPAVNLPENSHMSGGHDEIITEFLDQTTVRAREYMPWFKSRIASLPRAEQTAELVSKMVELSILLHPDNGELGFPIDIIQMRRRDGLRTLSMKSECDGQQNSTHGTN